MPNINNAGLLLIEQFEGLRLRAYPDPGTGGEPWTIGFGHTANVHPGQSCTSLQAQKFLTLDVGNAARDVAFMVEIALTPNQFAALTSFQYNTGALRDSSLLRCLNARDLAGAQAEFGRWIYAGGEVLEGLVRRRAAEAKLFATP